MKNKLIENYISLGIVQGINYILPLVTIPFLFMQLGVEKYGFVNFNFAFINYFVIFTDFGFGLSGTRYIAENRENHSIIELFYSNVFFSRLLLLFVSFSIFITLLFLIPLFKSDFLFSICFFLQVIGSFLSPTWFFQGMEQMRYITIVNVITKFVSITPLFFIVNSPGDYIFIPICYGVGYIVSGIYTMWLIKNKFKILLRPTTITMILDVTKDSSKYFLSRVSVSMFTNTNTFLLGVVVGNVYVGYYSLAEKIYSALNTIYAPINGVIFPYMTKMKNLKLFKRILYYGIVINTAFVLSFYFVFPYIIPFVMSDFPEESFSVLSILLFAILLSLPSTFLGYPFLAAFGHPNYTNFSLIIVSVFNILILAMLYVLNVFSIYSVAVAVVLTELLLLIIRVRGVVKFKLWTSI